MTGTILKRPALAMLVVLVRVLEAAADESALRHRIAGLVQQLGAEKFSLRESAQRQLIALGEPALPLVRIAAESDDLEVRKRARDIQLTILLSCRVGKSSGVQLALLTPGEFTMGSPPAEQYRFADEQSHSVRISRPFLMGVHEVTQAEFVRLMKFNPSWFASAGGGREKIGGLHVARFPVEQVTWFDAAEFCNRLSQQDGYPAYYVLEGVRREKESIVAAEVAILGGNGYRLPLEAEWEYACRAGTRTAFHYGAAGSSNVANLKGLMSSGGYGSPTPIPALDRMNEAGSYRPNAWSLFDMHGNAAEWCEDWYDKEYYANSPRLDPRGPEAGTHRIVRGGSWLLNEGACRSAARSWQPPGRSSYTTGFRVCRTP